MKIKSNVQQNCEATYTEANFRFRTSFVVWHFFSIQNWRAFNSPMDAKRVDGVREFFDENKFEFDSFCTEHIVYGIDAVCSIQSEFILVITFDESVENSELNLNSSGSANGHLIQVNLSVSLKMILMNLRDH